MGERCNKIEAGVHSKTTHSIAMIAANYPRLPNLVTK